MPPKLIKALQSFITIKQKAKSSTANPLNNIAGATADQLVRQTSAPITKGKKKLNHLKGIFSTDSKSGVIGGTK